MPYIDYYESPLGRITLASDGDALTGLWLDGQSGLSEALKEEPKAKAREAAPLPVFEETRRWLDLYFSGKDPEFTPKLAPHGTAFRLAVWELLLSIPYGRTRSYGEIAARIADARGIEKMAAQAVGAAVGKNPISIIIPCHRVIGADGSLTGYGGGLDKKEWLLRHEGAFRAPRPA